MQATDTVSPPSPSATERPARPASTLVVVRDGAAGIEVLLSRRTQSNDQFSGAWVFPGGIVEKNRTRHIVTNSHRAPGHRARGSAVAALACTALTVATATSVALAVPVPA